MLETDRLLLRPWRDNDIPTWVTMSSDSRVMEFYTALEDRATAEATAQRLRGFLDRDGFGCWACELKQTHRFIGIIALQMVPFDAPFTPALEIGWRLVPEVWGNGYATEGATAAMSLAFDVLKHDEVVAMTAAINIRSQRVMQRLGMSYDPRDDFMTPRVERGHRLAPHVLYRMPKSRWLSMTAANPA